MTVGTELRQRRSRSPISSSSLQVFCNLSWAAVSSCSFQEQLSAVGWIFTAVRPDPAGGLTPEEQPLPANPQREPAVSPRRPPPGKPGHLLWLRWMFEPERSPSHRPPVGVLELCPALDEVHVWGSRERRVLHPHGVHPQPHQVGPKGCPHLILRWHQIFRKTLITR